jgi:hypothetical protein
MSYVYCWSTAPTGKYNGGAVVTRISRHKAKSSSMPANVHAIFQATAKELNFNLATVYVQERRHHPSMPHIATVHAEQNPKPAERQKQRYSSCNAVD